MKVKANGIEMNYTLDGPANAPVVTLSHSLATDNSMWDPQMDALRARYRVLRYETRGHGGTETPIEMMFIRAPRIRRVGESVEVLARQNGDPVMARQGTVLVATFHPEVIGEQAIHRYFCHMVRDARPHGSRRTS